MNKKQELVISRKQAKKIWKVFKENKEINQVTLTETSNGIGPELTVSYPTIKDITDVEMY